MNLIIGPASRNGGFITVYTGRRDVIETVAEGTLTNQIDRHSLYVSVQQLHPIPCL